MTEQDILAELEERIELAIEAFRREIVKLRTGRANAGILDGIRIDYYGAETPLNQIANVSVLDARMLQVKPWERNLVNAIEKAILASDLGLTPSNRGDLVLVPVPTPTGDRRREMVKILKKFAEEAKVSLRSARRDANDMVDLIDEFPEDDSHRAKKRIQEHIDAASKRVDAIVVEKEAEILEV